MSTVNRIGGHTRRKACNGDQISDIKYGRSAQWPVTVAVTALVTTSACQTTVGDVKNPRQPAPTTVLQAPDTMTRIGELLSVSNYYKDDINGKGSLVAIVDTGIRIGLADLDSRITSHSIYIEDDNNDYGDLAGHGTSMAGLIANTGKGTGLVGMAPRARLLVVRTDTNEKVGTPLVQNIADGIRYASDKQADIINVSLSASKGPINSAISYAAENHRIVTIATGNFGSTSVPSDIAADAGTYGPTVVAVTSVNDSNHLASFAAPCKVKNPKYCIAAPGVRVNTIDIDGNPTRVSGTSASTAIVSGGLALMRQYFPDLSPEKLVDILLQTADDLGATGVDDIYGSGLVNFEAAMQPIGNLQLQTGETATTISTGKADMAAAFGDALAQSAALATVPVYDDYDREFSADVRNALFTRNRMQEISDYMDAQNARHTSELGPLRLSYSYVVADELRSSWQFTAVHGEADGPRFATFFSQGRAPQTGFDGLLNESNSASFLSGYQHRSNTHLGVGYAIPTGFGNFSSGLQMSGTPGDQMQTHAHASFATDLFSNLRIEGGVSALYEKGTFLNSEISGAFGKIDMSTTLAARGGVTFRKRNVSARLTASLGRTYVNMAEQGLISGFRGLRTSEVHATVNIDHIFQVGDHLAFGVSRPMRISAGKMHLYDGSSVALKPSGREQIAHISYTTHLGPAELRGKFFYGQDLGNIRDQPDQFEARLGLSLAF